MDRKEKCWLCDKFTEVKLRNWGWNEFVAKSDVYEQKQKIQESFECSFERVFCDECFEKFKAEKRKNLKEYLRLKTIIMHERALRYMEKSMTVFMCDLKEASDYVLNQAMEKNCFMSSHEMITAMILYDECIDYEPQAKIGKHTVDFELPQVKAVLEIDGYMHTHKKKEDSERDTDIRAIKGKNWEVVRIDTKYIEQNPAMIFPAIQKIIEYKRKGSRNSEEKIFNYYRTKKY